MSLPSTTVHEVQYAGSDAANAGVFDPSNANMATDGAWNTGTGAFSSASYNFVSGDVGNWLFIQGGTHWLAGWYKIASVSSNKATLTTTAGQAILTNYLTNTTAAPVDGSYVSGTASGVWTVDYSQQTSSIAIGALSSPSGSAGTTINSIGFTKAMVGNGIVIPSGVTHATAGVYLIVSVTATTSAVLDRNWNSGSVSVGWNAGIGAAFASMGFVAGIIQTSNLVWIKYNASPYLVTTTSTNVANGCINITTGGAVAAPMLWTGYQTLRNDYGTPPNVQASNSISGVQMYRFGGTMCSINNIGLDGNNYSGMWGFAIDNNTDACQVYKCKVSNFASYGISIAYTGSSVIFCAAENCAIGFLNNGALCYGCTAQNCSSVGFYGNNIGNQFIHCIANGCNSGFGSSNTVYHTSCFNCSAYNSGFTGFNLGGLQYLVLINCVAYTSGIVDSSGWGFYVAGGNAFVWNCAVGNSYTADVSGTPTIGTSFITLTANPFNNAAGGDFSLNSVAGGGALLKGAGFPASFSPTISTNNYLDIGAAQHQTPTIAHTFCE